MDQKRKTVAVSACLLGENCKYNGGNNRDERLLRWLEGKKVVPVCPEVFGGLSIPRAPAEIVDGEVRTKEGISVHEAFVRGAEKALSMVEEAGAELVILQSRSPSCGVGEIYDGTFSKRKIPGDGIFVGMLKERGYSVCDVEELFRET